MLRLQARCLLRLIALLCFGAIGLALLSQHLFDMPPCAWCVMQRLIYLVIGILAFVGSLGGPGWARWCSAGSALFSIAGAISAWYQHTVAAHLFSCDQTFADRLMTNSGLDSGLPWLFGIYASCMDAKISILGVEYVLWSLALFVFLFFVSVLAMFRRAR